MQGLFYMFSIQNLCSMAELTISGTGGAEYHTVGILSRSDTTSVHYQIFSRIRFGQVYFLKFWSACQTFIISFESSLMVAWISGTLTRLCIAFITSVLFCSAPATLRTAVRIHKHRDTLYDPYKSVQYDFAEKSAAHTQWQKKQ